MSFLKPLRLFSLISLGIIIFMYLKKRKIKEIKVSSTLLWDKVFKEIDKVKKRKVNKYLLLVLDLLIATFIIMAFAKPKFRLFDKGEKYSIFVDVSMSMNALEDENSHMDMVKKEIKDFANGLKDSLRYNLVLMKKDTEIYKSNINKDELIKEVNVLKSENEPLDLEKANRVINASKGSKAIFTDKNVFKRKNVIKVGKDLKDLGIIYAGVYDKNKGYYCILKNYGSKKSNGILNVKDENGNILGNNKFDLKPNEEKKVQFDKLFKNTKIINFYIDNKDMISENNYYPVYLKDLNYKKVAIVGENYFLEKVFKVLPYLKVIKIKDLKENHEKFDFYIVCKDNVKNIPKEALVWWVKPESTKVKNNIVNGNFDILNKNLKNKLNNDSMQGEGYELLNAKGQLEELIKIDNKLVMGIDKDNDIYSSVNLDKCEIVLTPEFPILIKNIVDNFWIKDSDKIQSKDYVINDNGESENSKDSGETFLSNFINVDLTNMFIIVVVIMLVIEWQVFKNQYRV